MFQHSLFKIDFATTLCFFVLPNGSWPEKQIETVKIQPAKQITCSIWTHKLFLGKYIGHYFCIVMTFEIVVQTYMF